MCPGVAFGLHFGSHLASFWHHFHNFGAKVVQNRGPNFRAKQKVRLWGFSVVAWRTARLPRGDFRGYRITDFQKSLKKKEKTKRWVES